MSAAGSDMDWRGRRIAITGATGFLGGAAARRLRARGASVVGQGRSAVRGRALVQDGIEFRALGLDDARGLGELFAGADAALHCAAKSAPWGPAAEFEAANVAGTDNVIAACSASGVRRLVHVSSPSIYVGAGELDHVAEDHPLPRRAINHYAATKRRAEQRVCAAAKNGLDAIILRPRAIFGPGDTALFPRLLAALGEGRLPVIGDGCNRADLTYVDNAVDACELALAAGPGLSGRAYNITNGEPVRLWELIGEVCTKLGLSAPRKRVSRGTAKAFAAVAEALHATLRRPGEPRLTRYSVEALARTAVLDISAARRDLGYAPQVTMAEGVERFVDSVRRRAA